MNEFKFKDFDEILKILKNRNPNVMDIDLINCSKWIYEQIKEKDL